MQYCLVAALSAVAAGGAFSTQEHIDYDLVESTNPEWGRAVVRVNVFRQHRQVRQCCGKLCRS